MQWLRFGVIGSALVVLTGCSTFFTGGGWIPSASGEGKATFGFNIHCTGDPNSPVCGPAQAHGSYHDMGEGVRLNFDGVLDLSGNGQRDNCVQGNLSYRSQVPSKPGGGQLNLVACDNGEPGSSDLDGDELSIRINSGPFAGYANSSRIRGGNLQAH